MNKRGPIVIIEDDADDRLILDYAFKNLNYPNEVVFFNNGREAIDYIKKPEVLPFLVISDINMHGLNGYEVHDIIHKDDRLRPKCIPYIFMTTSNNRNAVMEAYSRCIQGFFVKPTVMGELKNILKTAVEYWGLCQAPFSS